MMKICIPGKMNLPICLAVSLLLLATTATNCYAGLREGLTAYDKADYATAMKELKPLAEKGDAKAQNALGRMYSLGQGGPKDSRGAAEWFLKAAEQGIAEAQGMLGYMYLVGEGAPQNNGKAYEWMSKAAEQGDAMAQYNLGVMYGGKGVKEEPAKAVHWMRNAAEQGHKYALNSLALMYQEGKGVSKDRVLAHMLYGLSGKAGNINARKSQKDIAAHMSSAQVREANELVQKWEKNLPLPVISKTGTKK